MAATIGSTFSWKTFFPRDEREDKLSASSHEVLKKEPKLGFSESMHSTTTSATTTSATAKRRSTSAIRSKELELRSAHEAVKGCFDVIQSYLETNGLEKEILNEIKRKVRRLHYEQAMSQAQLLMQKLPFSDSYAIFARILLCVNMWQTICKYTDTRYRHARKIVFQVRYEKASRSSKEIKNALKFELDMAEELTASQRGLYVARQWQNRWESRQHRSKSEVPPRH